MKPTPAALVALAVACGSLALAAACTIDVPLEGKRCPCAEGFVCDDPIDRCVPHICDPALTVADLTVMWATPGAIALRWAPAGDTSVASYEIVLAETLDDIAARAGTARVVGSEENPELGTFTTSPWTIVRDVAPAKAYLARVVARDATGCTAGSNVASVQTPPAATGYVDIFTDTVTGPAYTSPERGFAVQGGALVYTPADDPECQPVPGADAICGQPLRIQGLSIPLAKTSDERPGLDDAAFARAFVEIAIENTGALPSTFAEVFLRFDACNPDLVHLYELAGFTLPARLGLQIVQLPLSQLAQAGVSPRVPLTFGVVDQRGPGTALCGVGIGAQWNKAGRVRIDDIKIRY